MNLNLFATIMTYDSLASNYRGENELNRNILQKVVIDGRMHTIVGSGAIRSRIREVLGKLEQKLNRERIYSESNPQVKYDGWPNPDVYIDDWLCGYMIAQKGEMLKGHKAPEGTKWKRDSILRINHAVSLVPYEHDLLLMQAPQIAEAMWLKKKADGGDDDNKGALVNQEISWTAYQYVMAIDMMECRKKPEWTRALFAALDQLSCVAGNHTRGYYEFVPASIVARLTSRLAAGYKTYGYNEKGEFPRVVADIIAGVLPGNEFYMAGDVVRQMDKESLTKLKNQGVFTSLSTQECFDTIVEKGLATGQSKSSRGNRS